MNCNIKINNLDIPGIDSFVLEPVAKLLKSHEKFLKRKILIEKINNSEEPIEVLIKRLINLTFERRSSDFFLKHTESDFFLKHTEL